MPESVGLPWYSTGTVTLTQGSTAVVGVGTNWKNAGLKIGDIFTIDRVTLYMIASVNSNTSITLAQAYAGTSGNTMNYYVIRNFAATLQAELSEQVSQLVGDYESWKDGRVNEIAIPFDFSSLYKGVWATGRSYKALDIVMYNSALYVCLLAHTSASGNTPGTAGAINYWGSYAPAMPAGIDVLNYNNAAAHNSLYRGKNLGTAITAQQLSAIRNSSFADLYPGDYWSLPIDGTTIAQIMHFYYWHNFSYINGYGRMFRPHAIVQLFNSSWNYAINDTLSTEGGLLYSKLWTEILPEILSKVQAVIGAENIFSRWSVPVCDAVDETTGLCSHRTTVTSSIFMPSAYNVLPYMDDNVFKYAGNNRDLERWAYYAHYACHTSHNIGFWLDTPASKTAFYQAFGIWGMLIKQNVYPQPTGDVHGMVAPYIVLL